MQNKAFPLGIKVAEKKEDVSVTGDNLKVREDVMMLSDDVVPGPVSPRSPQL